MKARILRIKLGISYVGTTKLSPVLRMGLLMGTGNMKYSYTSTNTQTGTYFNPNPPYNTTTTTTVTKFEQEAKYYGGVSFGFYSALGVNYKLNDALSLSLCLDVVVQDFAPKKGKLTKQMNNGVDELAPMLLSDKEVTFEKNYTEISGTPPNNSSPGKAPKISFPLSSFGPSFTILYTFGTKSNSEASAPVSK